MHCGMKEMPIVGEYGEGFCSRMVEWSGIIISNETFPKGLDATPLFKGLPEYRMAINRESRPSVQASLCRYRSRHRFERKYRRGIDIAKSAGRPGRTT